VSASESQPKQPPRPAPAPPRVASPTVPKATPEPVAKPVPPGKALAPKNDKVDDPASGPPAVAPAPASSAPRAAPAGLANPHASAQASVAKTYKGQSQPGSPAAKVRTPSPALAKAAPGVVGALAKAGARTTTEKPPPFSSVVGPPSSALHGSPAAASRPKALGEGDAPPSRSPTLIIDEPQQGHPAPNPSEPRVNGPPLVAPSTRVVATNAVTKSPPWTEAASDVGRALSIGVRPTSGSVREITSSMLLEDSGENLEPYELSSALLVEDTSQVDVPPPVPASRQTPPKDPSELVTVPVRAMGALAAVDSPTSRDVAVGTAVDVRERPASETRRDASAEAWVARMRLRLSAAGTSFVRIGTPIRTAIARVGSVSTLRRSRWAVSVVALVAVLAVSVFVFGTRSKIRVRENPRTEDKAIASPPEETAGAHPAAGPSAGAPEIASSAPPHGCVVAGPSRVVAETALLAAGVEARALRTGIGLGFVPTDRQATVVRLDPKTLAVGQMVSVRTPDVIRRVTPILAASGALNAAVDEDVKNDKAVGRRTIPVEPPIQVGTAGGQLAWSRLGGHTGGKLWPVDTGADVDAIRGAWAPGIDHGLVALAFRRAGAVWVGALDTSAAPTAIGSLARIAGLGPTVGSPAIAFDGATVMVAWADRAASDDPWRLRLVRFRNGDPPGEPSTFSPPPGGRGGQAMSPGLAVVPVIGFLLSWTEGAISAHDVRALTLANDGTSIGAPLALSNEGVNAGQGQAAIDLEGHGLVAFLQGGGGVFQVAATPITCPGHSSQ